MVRESGLDGEGVWVEWCGSLGWMVRESGLNGVGVWVEWCISPSHM